jgi:peptidoglycan/xylan/chitin deacetylase (PgdA/CDA1 family)
MRRMLDAPGRTRAALAVALALLAAPAAPAPRLKVALTFDDLPVHGTLPPGRTRSQMAKDIVAALGTGHATAFGFLNAKTIDGADSEDVLRVWREAGLPIGSHTFSHMDLHLSTAEAFEQDVIANEEALQRLMPRDDWRWFRFPYLHEGETIEKRRRIADFLARRGYRVAEVTISFDDWAYHDPYARCLARGDQKSVAWLQRTYLDQAGQSIDEARAESRALYGREIAHVMLLHLGDLNAVMTRPLLALLRQRSFDVVPLAEAEGDPAYAERPDVALPSGATLFGQVRAQKAMPAATQRESVLPRLAELCK